MIKFLSIFLIFFSIFCTAQNEESLYLQQEHDRISRVQNHEINIKTFINQSIVSYSLPPTVYSKLSTQQDEDGYLLSGTELDSAILVKKKELLRQLYFNNNSIITNDYIAHPLTSATSCVNNGFEDGTTASFTFLSERPENWTIFKNFPTNVVATPTNEFGIVSLISGSQSVDPKTGFKRVKSGNYSIRLNNDSNGGKDVSLMRRPIVVGSNQDNITFNYALVLEDPQGTGSHTNLINNPYYQCRLITPSGEIIIIREIVADRNNKDVFFKTPDGKIVYTDWLCESIDVSQFRGQTVIVEVIVGDCGLTGHWGYAYFDNFCGTNCAAPTFGKVTLDAMGITCPLLPLTVSGNFIAPAGYELDKLTLQAKDFLTQAVVYEDTSGLYSLFGNEFSFNVTGQNLFPSGPTNKQFDFFVKAKFKLIGTNSSTMEVPSQSANVGPDVTFINGTCQICNSCAAPTNSYWYQGRYPLGTHNDGINSWVDYLDPYGNIIRQIIGPIENGCQLVEAVSIVATNEVSTCSPQEN